MTRTGKFIGELLDLEVFWPRNTKPGPTLKVILDNLRCYPVLALFGLGVGYLSRSDSLVSQVAAYAMLPVLVLLLLCLIFQSSFMFGCLILGVLGGTIEPAASPTAELTTYRKIVNGVATVLGVVFFAVFVVASINLFGAIVSIMKRVNI